MAKVYGYRKTAKTIKPQTVTQRGSTELDYEEKEFNFSRPADEMLKRGVVSRAEVRKGKFCEGIFCTVTAEGKVETNLVKTREGFKKFLSSTVRKVSLLKESDPFATGTDILTTATSGNMPDDEYAPIMGGPFTKQMYIFDYLDMHAKVFWYKNHMPLAKQIVDIITFFAIGKGVTVTFKNPQMQEKWNAFAKRVKLGEFIRMDADSITWMGELMTRKLIEGNLPTLKHIDPSTVWEVVTDPRDIEKVFYYHQQFPTQWQLVYKAKDEAAVYVVNDIPAEEVIHVKINSVPGEKRGRSDLLPVLGYLKRMRNFLDAKVIKAQIEASWCLKRKVKGSQADVDRLAQDSNNNTMPPPGSQIWENEAIETEFIGPTMSGARGEDGMLTDLKGIIATGVGLSPEYLGAGGTGQARATAITKSEPAARKFESRQILLENYIRQIADWWLTKEPGLPTQQITPVSLALVKKYLLARDFKGLLRVVGLIIVGPSSEISEPVSKDYEVIFPEIDSGDRKDKILMISQMEAAGDISHAKAAALRAKELSITSYDFEEEQQTRQEEAAEGTGSVGLDPGMAAAQGGDGSAADDAEFKDEEKDL